MNEPTEKKTFFVYKWQLLQYHNFYIDMNFLIHNSVRNAQYPNELTNINTVTESDIFEHVLNSVETLLRLIQPSKLFFMSMDGVAPHAKWNKQRQRRLFIYQFSLVLFLLQFWCFYFLINIDFVMHTTMKTI